MSQNIVTSQFIKSNMVTVYSIIFKIKIIVKFALVFGFIIMITLSAGFLLGLLLPFKNSRMKTRSERITTGTMMAIVPITEKTFISLDPALAANVPVEGML